MLRRLTSIALYVFGGDKAYKTRIKDLIGFYPRKSDLFRQAFKHNSVTKKLGKRRNAVSNERLEFLGDAVLDMVIAELMFKKFPFRGEGFLTEMRSKIVSRKTLVKIAGSMGIDEILEFDSSVQKNRLAISNISGNALEALIGAIYLDMGYRPVRSFVIKKMLKPYIDLNELEHVNENFKSMLYQWSQREKKKLEFRVLEESGKNHKKKYTIGAFVDDVEISSATAFSKKRAEQKASEKAVQILKIPS